MIFSRIVVFFSVICMPTSNYQKSFIEFPMLHETIFRILVLSLEADIATPHVTTGNKHPVETKRRGRKSQATQNQYGTEGRVVD